MCASMKKKSICGFCSKKRDSSITIRKEKTKQYKTKQNKTKQNKTKQNKTKQNNQNVNIYL